VGTHVGLWRGSVFCYTYRTIPSLDRRKIATLKRVLYSIIVDSKFGLQGEPSMFSFKYVPEYSEFFFGFF
jgi:hypothetical protein